jgi:hypothetical protein
MLNQYNVNVFGIRELDSPEYDDVMKRVTSILSEGILNFSKDIAAEEPSILLVKNYSAVCREYIVNVLFQFMDRINLLRDAGYRVFVHISSNENRDYHAKSLHEAVSGFSSGERRGMLGILCSIGQSDFVKMSLEENGTVNFLFCCHQYTSPINISAALLAARLVPYMDKSPYKCANLGLFVDNILAIAKDNSLMDSIAGRFNQAFGVNKEGLLALVIFIFNPRLLSNKFNFNSTGPRDYVTGRFFTMESWCYLNNLSKENRQLYIDMSKTSWVDVLSLKTFIERSHYE